MSLTINTNSAAISAAYNLGKNNSHLQKSLAKLSSGSRITTPSDDAGGLAVSMKLNAAINRTRAAITNVQNARSFAEVQDGGLQAAARIVDRMAELKSLSTDVLKSAADKANYDTEFQSLRTQLWAVGQEAFNGVSLFSSSATFGGAKTVDTDFVEVITSSQGSGGAVVSLNKSLIASAVTVDDLLNPTTAGTAHANATALAHDSNKTGAVNAIGLADISISTFTQVLDNLATLRAENGATVSRLSFAEDHLRLSKANLTAANSRIVDVDIAEETTRLAKYNILVQASASMLAQANLAPNSALLLLS
ncbi:MAG: flagellin [Opitutae bacterium]|nr:flagellin [Opitutae bacterium]